ncbi:MAG: O-acetyl-ADP-ribose deacetylase [Acidimicrobiia bacterium]
MTEMVALQGDITTALVDAIVNAANSSLMGGGGVDGAIHRAGGPEILAECRLIVQQDGPLDTGKAVITTAGMLPARHVIHTVGPIWGTLDESEAVALLGSCYTTSLDVARDNNCHSIAFPNISTGVYRFPLRPAATTAIGAVRRWAQANPDALERVEFVCHAKENLELYRELLTT